MKYFSVIFIIFLCCLLFIVIFIDNKQVSSVDKIEIDSVQILKNRNDSLILEINKLNIQMDSVYKSIKSRKVKDSIVIIKKYQTINNKIILLSDSESVKLLIENLNKQ